MFHGQLVDIFTKGLANPSFQAITSNLGMDKYLLTNAVFSHGQMNGEIRDGGKWYIGLNLKGMDSFSCMKIVERGYQPLWGILFWLAAQWA